MGVLYAKVSGQWVLIGSSDVSKPRGYVGLSQLTSNTGAVDTTSGGLVLPGLQVPYTSDGTRVLHIVFQCAVVSPVSTPANGYLLTYIADNAVAIQSFRSPLVAAVNNNGVNFSHTLVPAVGSHNFTIRGQTSGGTCVYSALSDRPIQLFVMDVGAAP